MSANLELRAASLEIDRRSVTMLGHENEFQTAPFAPLGHPSDALYATCVSVYVTHAEADHRLG